MLKDALDELGRKITRDARFNLKRVKKGNSNLYKSLKYKVDKNSITFTLPEYWEYVDAGVKGVGGSKADGTNWKVKKVTNSKFKYRDKMPPLMAFNGWTIKKRIAPRSKGGQFTSRKSLLFAISKSVYHTGIATTDFFTEPVDTNVLLLAPRIAEQQVLDLIDNIIIE
jgi:hypothetical protein|tara:strand:+ start:166 stop:669 length:504 start_codon:yes stop_codon:yes gene_type:complete